MSTFYTQDLVLKVRSDYDPGKLRLDRYEAFIDALCQDREYQKEAIRIACRFLSGGEYAHTTDLAGENFRLNPALAERYGSLSGLLANLPFPRRLACSVDLATATGKSYVMYGIARILLAEGSIDRVLVLCPSLTIEAGLKEKFLRLTTDGRLNGLIPGDAVIRTPEIKDASETTGVGDICVENIHATFEHVSSSVKDSFAGRGSTTLVLNDEAHHIYTPPTGQRAIKRWKEFLGSEDYGFMRIVGLSGTCYVGNDYFSDVVYRYSLRHAMEDGVVKTVHYVAKDESTSQHERFQKYLQVHTENQARYGDRKPLSIVVTGTIKAAEKAAHDFTQFLIEHTGTRPDDAERLVLVVTSRHKENVAKLPYVDRDDYPTEWIFSVGMLTEGWDVSNVFQIVPHEKRAFNSKLLIAQVLGRGLRAAGMDRPVVRVFNHSSWSSEIKDLVDEVLEQEMRLHSYPVKVGETRHEFHFNVHQMRYETRTYEQDLPIKNGNGQVSLFKRGYISFESQPRELQRHTTFVHALDGSEYSVAAKIRYPAYSVDEVVRKILARLRSVDLEAGTSYARDYPAPQLRAVIEASLERIGEDRDLVWEQNLQHALRAVGNTQRRMARTVRIELIPGRLIQVSTRDMRVRSTGYNALRKEAAVFYDSASSALSLDADRRLLQQVIEDESLPKSSSTEVRNRHWFRSPVNFVLATHAPERRFLKRLFEPPVAEAVRSWVKAPDTGFYEISYTWRKGDHTKQGRFNPDFFVMMPDGTDILLVELKSDSDDSDENRAKLTFAIDHFRRVNEAQSDVSYHVHMVSPESYDAFFQALLDGSFGVFRSSLQARLLA